MEDEIEWEETYDLLFEGEEIVVSELSVGNFVTLKQELFNKMIDEINNNRIKNSNPGDAVELIIVSEPDGDIEVDSED